MEEKKFKVYGFWSFNLLNSLELVVTKKKLNYHLLMNDNKVHLIKVVYTIPLSLTKAKTLICKSFQTFQIIFRVFFQLEKLWNLILMSNLTRKDLSLNIIAI